MELDRPIEYWNPHYLTRPGSQMPSLAALSITQGVSHEVVAESIDETQKSRSMQLFNSANGPSKHLNVTPSPRLMTRLNM